MTESKHNELVANAAPAQCTYPKCQTTGGCNGPCKSVQTAVAVPDVDADAERAAYLKFFKVAPDYFKQKPEGAHDLKHSRLFDVWLAGVVDHRRRAAAPSAPEQPAATKPCTCSGAETGAKCVPGCDDDQLKQEGLTDEQRVADIYEQATSYPLKDEDWHSVMAFARALLASQPAPYRPQDDDPTGPNHPGHHDGLTCEEAAQRYVDVVHENERLQCQIPVSQPATKSTTTICPPELPKFMPDIPFPSNEALWDHAVLTGWRAAQPAAPVATTGWKDKLRWSKANTDYHGYIAFTHAQLEHFVAMLNAAPAAVVGQDAGAVHPDDIAVDAFAAAMKAKMAKQRVKGYSGWDDQAQCTDAFLADALMAHTQKGDPVDVANFAMMLHQRNIGNDDIAAGELKVASLRFVERVYGPIVNYSEAAQGHGGAVAYTSKEKLKKVASLHEAVETMWSLDIKDADDVALYTRPQPPARQLSKDQIRTIFIKHGFTVKEGQTDLKQYVFDAAEELLAAIGSAPAQAMTDAKIKNVLFGIGVPPADNVMRICKAILAAQREGV